MLTVTVRIGPGGNRHACATIAQRCDVLHLVLKEPCDALTGDLSLSSVPPSASLAPPRRAVRLELQNGLPVLRASTAVQRRITALLRKQQKTTLSAEEIDKVDCYRRSITTYFPQPHRAESVTGPAALGIAMCLVVVDIALRREYHRRALGLCEYCHTAEQWQYVPLPWITSCGYRRVAPNTPRQSGAGLFSLQSAQGRSPAGNRPKDAKLVALFHPRRHRWDEHFIWSADGLRIVGLTAIGRATIAALDLNRQRVVHIRAANIAVDRIPPPADLKQRSEADHV